MKKLKNGVRRKGSGKDSILVPILLILFLMGASAILEVAWLGIIGSILILLQYVYYIRTIRDKRSNEIERDSINDVLKEFVSNNEEVEAIWIYKYYRSKEDAGTMLIYQDCYCWENANIKGIIQEYYYILFSEYGKLNEREIKFISATDGRAYVSFRTSAYGKDYVAVFVVLEEYIVDGKLDLKSQKLKKDFILISML